MTPQPMTVEQALQLAMRQHQAGQFQQAESICRQILAADPNQTDAMTILGLSLSSQEQFDQAVESLQRAIKLRPNIAVYYCRLGQVLSAWGRLDEAIDVHRQAVSLQPDFADAHNDLGNALKLRGDFDDAIVSYRRAIEISPDYASAHYNLGLILLLRGNLREGFEQIDWRWRVPNLRVFNQDFPQPRWNPGEPLNGRRILIRAEQGFGDAIHFARYVPRVKQLGAHVIFAVRAELFRLMKTLRGCDELVTQGSPLVPFDVHCALLDLPRIFGTTLETIPAPIPYVHADPALSQHWHERLKPYPARKIGVAWSGSARATNNRRRSVPPEQLNTLLQLPGVTWISLQKGVAPPPEMKLLDWTADLNDFADTVALIDNLDAVVTVDTAVAHLAGAMGKPVFLLLAHVADWQWMLDREDSPWYPTMKLFRQPATGDWKAPIERAIYELQTL